MLEIFDVRTNVVYAMSRHCYWLEPLWPRQFVPDDFMGQRVEWDIC